MREEVISFFETRHIVDNNTKNRRKWRQKNIKKEPREILYLSIYL